MDSNARGLCAFDIDGTLLAEAAGAGTESAVAPEIATLVAELDATGVEIALVTGRQLHGARSVLDSLGIRRGWISGSKGATVARIDPTLPGGFHVLGTQQFDPSDAIEQLLRADPHALIALEDVARGYKVNSPWPAGELLGSQTPWIRNPESVTSLMAMSRSLSREQMLAAAAGTSASAEAYGPNGQAWLDLTPPAASKASGAEAIRISSGIDSTQTWAAGDAVSDVPLLTWAAHGVAMGQAPAAVKAVADEVAETFEAGGLLAALTELALERSGGVR